MKSSTTTAMAHSSMPWMPMAAGRPGAAGAPRPRAASGGAGASAARRAHMPRAGGVGRRGRGSAQGQAPRLSATLPSGVESSGELRGAASAPASGGHGCVQARCGGRASGGPLSSPNPCPTGAGGAEGSLARLGSPSHRGSPCAHWPRRGDHPRRRPPRPPSPAPALEGAEGGGSASPRAALGSALGWHLATGSPGAPERAAASPPRARRYGVRAPGGRALTRGAPG